MFSVKVQKSSGRVFVWKDILGSDINTVFMKVLQRLVDMSFSDERINKLSYSEITPDNAVELAKSYGYILTDVTAEYAPQHTIIGK